MYSFEGLWESFVVPSESAETSGPGEGAFDDPSARQQHEVSLRHGMLDHLEPDAGLLRGLLSVRTVLALIDISQFDGIAG